MSTSTKPQPARAVRFDATANGHDLPIAYSRDRALLAAVELDELKRAFLSNISHAVRAPLSSIIGFTSTLVRDDADLSPEERCEMLERLERNARRLNALVGDMLELERLAGRDGSTLERQPTEMSDLLRGSVRDLDVGTREIRIEAASAVVAVDPEKVQGMVRQLVLNAHRHTPPQGRIWLGLRHVGGGVQVNVDDEGGGIPDGLKGSVLEPLQHGPDPQHSPGLGVGLALVARYAELHGGRAWVEDRPTGGASFRIFLPSGG